jgi:hypothetical protein
MDKAELIRHEIEKRRIHNLAIGNPLFTAMAEEDIELLCFIDSLEVKEVDLDTDFGVCWGEYCDCGGNINDYKVAKHFFELGLKAKEK